MFTAPNFVYYQSKQCLFGFFYLFNFYQIHVSYLCAYLCFGFISFYLVVSVKDIGVFSCVVSTAPQLVWTFQIESCSVTKMFQYCPLQSLLQEVFYHVPLGWFITACCCFFWRCFWGDAWLWLYLFLLSCSLPWYDRQT